MAAAVRLAPAGMLRQVTALGAPLSRHAGGSRAGAAALAHAVALLAQAPTGSTRPLTGTLDVEGLAERTGFDVDEVRRWVDLGALGPPAETGPPPRWGRSGLERARLVAHLRRHGLEEDALPGAVGDDRVPALVVDQALAGRGVYDEAQMVERSGLPPQLFVAVWRALGLAPPDPGDRAYTRRDLEAVRLLGAMRAVFPDEDILEATSVVGRGMAQIAGAEVELFRRRLLQRFEGVDAGELERALRLASVVDLLVPAATGLLEMAHRHHLEAATRAESVLRVEEATGGVPGQVSMTVGFADLVGFTSASEKLDPLELGEVAGALLRCAETVLPSRGVRLVKTIGDAVMFAGGAPAATAAAALTLVEEAASVGTLPPLRAGLAHGPVLWRHADAFGRTVNVASRLCAEAPARQVLVHVAAAGEDPGWEEAGLAVASRRRMRLRGLERPVEVVAVRRRA